MSKEEYIAAIDIGSSNVSAVIAQMIPEEKPRIVGVGKSSTQGLRKGVIVDLEEVTQSIKSSVEQAERMAGTRIEEVYASVGGSHLSCAATKGVIAVGKADGEVTEEDVERAIEASQAINVPHNYEIIHIIPQSFNLDNQTGIKEPVGMNGVRLEMRGIIVIAFSPHLRNISKCLNNAGIDLTGFVASPLASAKSVLNKRQKELGVALIDIGGGTTSLAVYEERELIYLSVLPVGAGHITNDVAIGMRTSIDVAEDVKIRYGSALPGEIGKGEQINLAEINSEEEGSISRKHISEIIEARTEEIFQMAEKELKKINRSALLPAGAVLTGGGSCLHGMVDLAKDNLKLPAQVGFPMELSGLIDKVDDPTFAVSVGLIMWAAEEDRGRGSSGGDFLEKFKDFKNFDKVKDVKKWFKGFLPGS
ncbi:MAG: cell division protein FtsA [Candidatus Moranbacteria bacterium]|nr:cell division protein FtsA [Candidatus Moranbacteria bacterium]